MGNDLARIPNLFQHFQLKNPGDKLLAKVTKSGRQVIKVHTYDKGKHSATRYSNGTIVETHTTRPKK